MEAATHRLLNSMATPCRRQNLANLQRTHPTQRYLSDPIGAPSVCPRDPLRALRRRGPLGPHQRYLGGKVGRKCFEAHFGNPHGGWGWE